MKEITYLNDKPNGRFLIFGYDEYYPQGGMTDLVDSVDNIEEAIDYVTKHISNRTRDYYEVYDRVEGKEVDLDI